MSQFIYVAKPVYIEAYQISELESDKTQTFPGWLMPAIINKTIDLTNMSCNTRQGLVKINPTDWLIRLDDGEIYPCSDEIFVKKYEKTVGASS